MILLRAADRVPVPWKNGGGITREVAASPHGSGTDNFDWRVSIADVAATGAFSHFNGVDRILIVIEGRLRLEFASKSEAVVLGPGSQHAFAGDEVVTGVPIGSCVRDLNIMFRRDSWLAEVERCCAGPTRGNVRIAIALQACGSFDLLDALVLDDGEEIPTDFKGYLITMVRK